MPRSAGTLDRTEGHETGATEMLMLCQQEYKGGGRKKFAYTKQRKRKPEKVEKGGKKLKGP